MLFYNCSNSQSKQLDKPHQKQYQDQQLKNKFPTISTHSATKEVLNIMVTDIEGESVALSDVLTKNKNYIVSLMASWCGPCRTELNAFQKVADKWSSEFNTEVIALSIEKPSGTHKLFALVKKQAWTMQVYHDKMAYTSRELNVFDIPHTFLVNTNGEIAFSTEGFKSNIVSIYEREIQKLRE